MKQFALTPDMLTALGVFYPTGYAFVMFPDERSAREAAEALVDSHPDTTYLSPQTILQQLGAADGDSDGGLPSVGTEAATVEKYLTLAREGHHALLVAAPSDASRDRLMAVARRFGFSYAQKYHLLAMEDLE
ncbi:MAG TPA: RNA-binding protein [Burkholderiaceae bacterium]